MALALVLWHSDGVQRRPSAPVTLKCQVCGEKFTGPTNDVSPEAAAKAAYDLLQHTREKHPAAEKGDSQAPSS